MDSNETNFRLALIAIDEVQLTTRKLALTVEENHRQAVENHRQLVAALGDHSSAINSLATAMSAAFQGFRAHSQIQDAVIARLTVVESDLAQVKADMANLKPAS